MRHTNPQRLRLSADVARVFVPLLCNARFRGARGGRGSGKSHFVGEDLVHDCVRGHVRLVCAREVQNSIKDSSKQLIEDKINLTATSLGDPLLAKKFLSNWHITEREIVYRPTDSLIIFRGLQNHTAASIKSLEGFNRLWCEEAQTISQRSIDLAVPTFRSGSQLTFTWNPDKATDAVDKMFRENEGDPDFVCVEANYFDNPWFPEELQRDMERDKRRDPDKYAHVWLGRYRQASEARVFRNYEVREFETPADARFHFGADWGFSVDPSVLVRCFIVGRTLYIDHEAYAVGCEIDNTPALFAGSDKREPPRWQNPNNYPGVPGALDWPIIADSARPETISYMRKRGFNRMKPAVKGAGSVEDGIEFMKSYDIVIHPRCKHTIDEFSTYSYKIDPKTNEILPVLEDKNNHVIDAARYAVESTRRNSYTLDGIR